MATGTTTTVEYLRTGRPAKDYTNVAGRAYATALPRIACEDGFSLSVQAGRYLYSTPREDRGPWTHVEVGFPSAQPEPWADWKTYAEDSAVPTNTVYSYVPLELVEALIASHGGEVPA
jgi:hypothetical protein